MCLRLQSPFIRPSAVTERRSVADSILGTPGGPGNPNTTAYQYDLTMAHNVTEAAGMRTNNFGDLSKSVLNADETTYGTNYETNYFHTVATLHITRYFTQKIL